MLRFVGEVRRAVLHPGDLRIAWVGRFQSAFDSFLPLRVRASRARSSAAGVAMPLFPSHLR
jgi:hypothetical protein